MRAASRLQPITGLQTSVGNQATRALLQTKLRVGQSNDEYEQEADRVADHVMRTPEPGPTNPARPLSISPIQRQTENDYEEARADRTGPTVPRVSPPVESAVHASRGRGQEMSTNARRFFESRFGTDLSSVRIHSDAQAAAAAHHLRARAFTVGSDIFFAHAQYRPESVAGKRLMGHELAHVIQQRRGSVGGSRSEPGMPVNHQSVGASRDHRSTAPHSVLQRQAADPSNPPPEYVPQVGAPERKRPDVTPEELGRLDLDDIYQRRQLLRTRVETVATELDLDPGFLAANLFAEKSNPSVWTKTSGEVASEILGLDDWFDPAVARQIKRIIKEHPGLGFQYSDVTATGESWDVSTEKAGAGLKPRGLLPARKAVIAIGLYIKASENMLRTRLSNKGLLVAFNVLTPEERLTVLRLTFNAGIVYGEGLVRKLYEGGDISRTGKTTRDTKNAPRTAVLHMARAIHLSQVVFGRPASDYEPMRAGSVQERIDAMKQEEIQRSIKRAQRQHRVGRHEFPPPAI
jgi:hypothetical protein